MSKFTSRGWGLGVLLAGSLLAGVATFSASRPADASAPLPALGGDDQRGAQRPPAPTPGGDQIAVGRAVFTRTCGRCHPAGGTQDDIGPHVNNINWAQARMTTQIRSGSARMRPITAARLPDSDLPALMAYLRSIHGVQ